MTVTVRFAPSPTGLLHIGNVRAALFNDLFARRHGGRFILRLDDTDQARSRPEYEDAIRRDLKWLGLSWTQEERQSTRMVRYGQALAALKDSGRVYPCYETQGELDLKRKTLLGRGLPPVYDRAALKLTPEARAKLEAEGRKPHWRFRLDPAPIEWDDLIQGPKHFDPATLSDPVLVREDGLPLYSFCSVVDDADMGVTHIVRGEDHVTNTACQIQIFEALGVPGLPRFAHYPLLVSATGEEMSKRLGTFSLEQMREQMHIEPMAICALVARLGTCDPVEPVLSMDALAEGFDFAKISRATPKFSVEDLCHLSARILHHTPFEAAAPRLEALGLEGGVTREFWEAVRPNLETFPDVKLWWQITHDPLPHGQALEADFLAQAATLLPPEPWDHGTWPAWTDAIKTATGRKGRELFMPLRLALTGMDHGPEMKALLPLIGRTRCRERLAA